MNQNHWGWLTGMSSLLLLMLLPFSSYIAALPLIQTEWAMNNTWSSVVFSIYLVGYALSSLILVPLTDRFGARHILLLGAAILTISNLLFPVLAWNIWVGTCLRFAAGVGHVGLYIPGVKMVASRFASRGRGTAVGIFVGAGYAGTTLSFTLMGVLLGLTPSWRIAYFITASLSLIGLGLAFFLAQEPLATSKQNVKGRLELTVLRSRPLALVILAYTLHTAELYLARLWFPLLLGAAFMQQGLSELEATTQAAFLAGFMFMMGILGVLAGGIFSDAVGRSSGAAVIFAGSGICSLVAGWLLGLPPLLLIIIGFVYGFLLAADSAVYSTAVTELAPPHMVGSAQAVQSFLGFAVGAAVPVAAGLILDQIEGTVRWGFAFSLNALIALIGVVALLWLRRILPANTIRRLK